MKRAFRPIGNDNKMVRLITNRAKIDPKKIVFAEADHLDVLKAAQIVLDEGIGQPILLGNMEIIIELKLGFEAEVEIIDTKIFGDERRNRFAIKYWETRKEEDLFIGCSKLMRERNYFAAMMVNEETDGLVTGY
jgi:malate dehydrogenase (oxaloacetate-decarboxylating)(NADP+)